MNKKLISLLSLALSVCTFWGGMQPALAQQTQTQRDDTRQTAGSDLTDYIVAIVQREPITYAQLKAQMLFMKQNNLQQTMSNAQLEQVALQQLITYSALTQRAKEFGLSVDPQMLVQAISMVATNNNKTVGQLRKDFTSAGIPFSTLEKSIEQQMLARMLRERLLDPTIYVNSSEIDAYLAQASKATSSSELMISLAQILIAVPENATKKQEDALRAKAQDVYKKVEQIKSIQDFIGLVDQYSDDPNKERTSGALGVMPVSAYPDIFIQAVNGLKAGEVASPVR
ncbi:MAG: peptidylprolyl isomerase, partial [Saezia sp.]